ncbi:Metallo-hydrolase/oxidoreductase [Mycena rosella]|uniref:Metallo-hydrolase/oxidoreductase n=1 Tax=Mycena rosella TaxID=1033263 RepID=A0AAD7D661_MYCRO|nr:Metallo-hydrolase/oxidoreductase [Mycena rosella]
MTIGQTASTASLPAPSADQPYMRISAMQAGLIHLPVDLIVAGESRTIRACPSLTFYLKHSTTDQHFIFDLGLRQDLGSYPPELQDKVLNLMRFVREGGLDPAAIQRVVISHLHFDHSVHSLSIGDSSPFSKATFILGGEGKAALDDGYPGNPKSKTLSSSTPADRTVFLSSADFNTSIGPFPHAVDFFGDGSVYIIDTPGHCAGHITILARTSPDGAWMYLGGDVAHDTPLITDPTTEIATVSANGQPYFMHRDIERAGTDIARVRALLELPRVEFIVAHDWKWSEDNLGNEFLPQRIAPKA